MNLESEIRRASRLRCRRCGLLGAALGCYDNDCKRSFHVPCALQIGCRWDVVSSVAVDPMVCIFYNFCDVLPCLFFTWQDERLVMCPKHVSKTLPCDKPCTHTTGNDNSSSLHQRFEIFLCPSCKVYVNSPVNVIYVLFLFLAKKILSPIQKRKAKNLTSLKPQGLSCLWGT